MDTRLAFLGGTGTVTGSKYLLEAAGHRVLLDCGLFQGYKQLQLRNWAPLPVDPAGIDAVVLTHAHLDHSGYLPVLIRQGFSSAVVCTAATRDLCAILLPDSGYLQERDAEFANRRGFSKHRPARPLYTEREGEAAIDASGIFCAHPSEHRLDEQACRRACAVAGARQVKIHGNYVPVRADVQYLDMLSAHADEDEIIAWLAHLRRAPRATFVTHGEPAASDTLRHRIEEELGWHCIVPEYRDERVLQ
jgi:Cft2 family RNA processing exonuclease